MNLLEFFPKYPNIDQNKLPLFNPYETTFEQSIYMKKEFYDEKLEPREDKVDTLLQHQKIISRFLSSHTPYNELLVLHETGSGKTCTAVGVVEQIKKENSSFKGAIIFAMGEAVLENFRNEIAYKCTDGEYIPQANENEGELTEQTRKGRLKTNLETYYSFNTFEKFAKQLTGMTDDDIRQNFSNKILIIDEVHNISIQKKKKKKTGDIAPLKIYHQFWRLCHNVINYKIMLLSATPMKTYFFLSKYVFL
jgi:superfamily II DNA or RNA helicase